MACLPISPTVRHRFAASLIEIERSCLEDGLVLAAIKIAEGHEIVCELVKIAIITNQSVHFGDGAEFRFQDFVPGDEAGDGFLALAGKDFPYPFEAELFDDRPCLCSASRLRKGRTSQSSLPSRIRR